MRFFSDCALKSCDQFRSDGEAPVFVDKLFVVYSCIVFSIDLPWSDHVVVICGNLLNSWDRLDSFNHFCSFVVFVF